MPPNYKLCIQGQSELDNALWANLCVFNKHNSPKFELTLGCPLFRKMSLMDFIMGDMLRLYVKVNQKKIQFYLHV